MKTSKLIRLRTACLFAAICASSHLCSATSEVFILTKDGVWFASDTRLEHVYEGRHTIQTVCKALVTPNRIMFNAGQFKDFDRLYQDEAVLPFDSVEKTLGSMKALMAINSMDGQQVVTDDPFGGYPTGAAGVIQVRSGRIEVMTLALLTDRHRYIIHTISTKLGIPHGFGPLVDDRMKQVAADPELAASLAKHPKEELLRLLEKEASLPNSNVGGPFTVLHMKPDGTIEDVSDNEICNQSISSQAKSLTGAIR